MFLNCKIENHSVVFFHTFLLDDACLVWFKDELAVEFVFKIIIVDKCDRCYKLIGSMCNLPLKKIR